MTTKAKTAKGAEQRPDLTAAVAYGKELTAQDYGPVTVIRAVTLKHPDLKRRGALDIAKARDINPRTASHQYQEVRSGKVTELEGL